MHFITHFETDLEKTFLFKASRYGYNPCPLQFKAKCRAFREHVNGGWGGETFDIQLE